MKAVLVLPCNLLSHNSPCQTSKAKTNMSISPHPLPSHHQKTNRARGAPGLEVKRVCKVDGNGKVEMRVWFAKDGIWSVRMDACSALVATLVSGRGARAWTGYRSDRGMFLVCECVYSTVQTRFGPGRSLCLTWSCRTNEMKALSLVFCK